MRGERQGFEVPREFVGQKSYRRAVRVFPGVAIKPRRQFPQRIAGTFQHAGRLRCHPAFVRSFIQPPAFQHDGPRLGWLRNNSSSLSLGILKSPIDRPMLRVYLLHRQMEKPQR